MDHLNDETKLLGEIITQIEKNTLGAESDLEDNSGDGGEVMGEETQIHFYNYAYEIVSLRSFRDIILCECIENISYLSHKYVSSLELKQLYKGSTFSNKGGNSL